jgi:hypothetical protein
MQAWLDQEDQHVAQTIRKHGQFIQLVGGDPSDVPPSFAYTVGLFGLGHPELVLLSAGHATCALLNDLGARIRAGDNLIVGSLRGRFPWDPGYASDPGLQPRPGTWRA